MRPASGAVDGPRRLAWLGGCALIYLVLGYVGWLGVTALAAVLVPVAVAVLLAALLWPVVTWLVGHRWPRGVAAAVVFVGALALLGGLVTLTVNALLDGAGGIGAALRDGMDQIRDWLVHGPVGLSERQVDAAVDDLVGTVASQAERIMTGVSATAAAVGTFLAGLVLALFVLFFLLYDGHELWRRLLVAVPERFRGRVDDAGRQAFHALSGYARATVVVAVVDAVAIGVGLTLLDVPMVIPLTSLVFLGAFVPYAGAFAAGLVAVLVALVSGGPLLALLVLVLNVGVQELEGDVLQPFLLGRLVRLHPLVVVLAVAVGVVVAGVVGALFAVPAVLTIRAVHGAVTDAGQKGAG